MTPANSRRKVPDPPVASAPAPADPSVPSPWLSALRTTTGAVLVVSAALGVAWAARSHVMTSPRFAVTALDVDGSEHRPAEAVAAESGIQLGAAKLR